MNDRWTKRLITLKITIIDNSTVYMQKSMINFTNNMFYSRSRHDVRTDEMEALSVWETGKTDNI